MQKKKNILHIKTSLNVRYKKYFKENNVQSSRKSTYFAY